MSDTPEIKGYWVPIAEMQSLERERNQARQELAEANRRACEYYVTDEQVIVLDSPEAVREARKKAARRILDMERELKESQDQRDNLQRLLENILREDVEGQDYKDARKYLARMKGGSDE